MRKSAGFEALRIRSNYLPSSRAKSRDPDEVTFKRSQRDPSTSLRMTAFSAAAAVPVRHCNSGRHVSFCRHNFRKKCIYTNRCKLRHPLTPRCHIVHTLLAFPTPCCQGSAQVYRCENNRRNRDAQNEFNHYARIARRNLRNRGKP
jgi:hypothetical protein